MSKLRYPYKENTLDGVFRLGIRTGLLNIKYDAKLSSEYNNPNFPASLCLDGNPNTFCHTSSSSQSQEYLQISFKDVKFKIEGFVILNREVLTGWDPLHYEIQGSNDEINFETIKAFNEDKTKVCGNLNNRTNEISTSKTYRSFRLRTTGNPCNVENFTYYTFNMAEFDLFGSFEFNESLRMKRRFIYIPLEIFVSLVSSY